MKTFLEAAPLLPGTLIAGKYRLRERIGEGAMGVVWAALNVKTGREVAVKVVVQPDPELRGRLLREARACGRLSHHNVVQVIDADHTARGEPFMVMPLLTGETLEALLRRRRRLEPREAARIGRDIARGLAAAHAARIVHRDLKPSNVFLETGADAPGYVIKLLDFGVSKVAATGHGFKTATGVILGSPGYLSPEQVRAQSDVDHRADIWALGVVLFEMLAGVRPFQGRMEVVLSQIVAGEIPSVARLVRGLDPRLADVVTWCMQRDRDHRVSSAAEVAAWLEAFVVPETVPLHTPVASQSRETCASAPAPPLPAPQPSEQQASSSDSMLQEQKTLIFRPAGTGKAVGARKPQFKTQRLIPPPVAPRPQSFSSPASQMDACATPSAAAVASYPSTGESNAAAQLAMPSSFPPPALPLDPRPRPRGAGLGELATAICAAGLVVGAVVAFVSIRSCHAPQASPDPVERSEVLPAASPKDRDHAVALPGSAADVPLSPGDDLRVPSEPPLPSSAVQPTPNPGGSSPTKPLSPPARSANSLIHEAPWEAARTREFDAKAARAAVARAVVSTAIRIRVHPVKIALLPQICSPPPSVSRA